jgi:hypothetical protein
MKRLITLALASILGLTIGSFALADQPDNYYTLNYPDGSGLSAQTISDTNWFRYSNLDEVYTYGILDHTSLPYSVIPFSYNDGAGNNTFHDNNLSSYLNDVSNTSFNATINASTSQQDIDACGLSLEQYNSTSDFYLHVSSPSLLLSCLQHTFAGDETGTWGVGNSSTTFDVYNYSGYHITAFYATSTSDINSNFVGDTFINNTEWVDLNYESNNNNGNLYGNFSSSTPLADQPTLLLYFTTLHPASVEYAINSENTSYYGYNGGFYILLYQQLDGTWTPNQYENATTTSTTTPSFSTCNPFSTDITHAFLNTDFNLGLCLSDIGTWLFVPTQALTAITNLKSQIENKPPFGYFTIISDGLNGLNATGTATTSLDQIVLPDYLKTSIFDPIKDGLAILLWFILCVFLFNRIKNIQL